MNFIDQLLEKNFNHFELEIILTKWIKTNCQTRCHGGEPTPGYFKVLDALKKLYESNKVDILLCERLLIIYMNRLCDVGTTSIIEMDKFEKLYDESKNFYNMKIS